MSRYKIAAIFILVVIMSLFSVRVFAAIDPGGFYYDKEVALFNGGTARLYFPQATGDHGEGNHHLMSNPNDPGSLFDEFFANAQSGKFFLMYDGNDVVDDEILMIALGEQFDDYFFMALQWQINDGPLSQNISIESADFNSNEYGYYPQWWKVARSGKPLIYSGSDEDAYYVIYVPLEFDGQSMAKGDVLSITYALTQFDAPQARIIFNVYGSSDTEYFYQWTNANDNTFGINSLYSSSQQNQPPMYPYLFGGMGYGGYYGGFWPGMGSFGGSYGGWGFSSPTGSYYGYGYGIPYSFYGSPYAGGYGYSPYGGGFGGFYGGGGYPYSNFYSGWSYQPYSFGYGGGYGWSPYTMGWGSLGGYYSNYYGRYSGF
ncbi:MAG: hypothetical protein ACMUIL_02675 [bacterium]